jgi:hypothetical protein
MLSFSSVVAGFDPACASACWNERTMERAMAAAKIMHRLGGLASRPYRDRGAGACRMLAELMRELGWVPIKARELNQLAGYVDKQRTVRLRS